MVEMWPFTPEWLMRVTLRPFDLADWKWTVPGFHASGVEPGLDQHDSAWRQMRPEAGQRPSYVGRA